MGLVILEVPAPSRPNSIQAESSFLREEHVALQGQSRRFVLAEITPHAECACQQPHGEIGYMRESTIERMVRNARIRSVGSGTTKIMLEKVAERP